MTNFTPFDVADYLDNDETIAAYLTAALEDPQKIIGDRPRLFCN